MDSRDSGSESSGQLGLLLIMGNFLCLVSQLSLINMLSLELSLTGIEMVMTMMVDGAREGGGGRGRGLGDVGVRMVVQEMIVMEVVEVEGVMTTVTMTVSE